jgi:tungstate transport system ATP-binding protein
MSGPSASPWVDLRQVTVRYGRVQALDQVTLCITPGERVALVGANGSGKSTLLRVLNGLADASGGFQCNTSMRQAMLFQRPHMLRTSAQNNVALALWLRGTRWRDARLQALTALQRVGLQGIAAQNARTLSGGQQQRVALARAWALRPDVLLLDEPTASLDPHAKREVEALMADFAASHGAAGPAHPVTMVFSSHNLGQVKRLASRVIYMEHGRLVADLPVHDFFNGPLPEAARLFVKGELV